MTLLLLIIIAAAVYYVFIYRQDYKSIFYGAAGKRCPNCSNPVEASFNVCPVCKETLKKKCKNCGNSVETTWKFCPYCETTLRKSEY